MRRVGAVGAALIVAWTLFAFGAVYAFVSRPAVAASVLLFLIVRPRLFRERTWPMDTSLLVFVAYGWLQLLPLPGALVSLLQPASNVFHASVALTPYSASAWRPLSLAPTAGLEAMLNLTAAALLYWTVRESADNSGTRTFVRGLALTGALLTIYAILQPVLFSNGKIYGFWSPLAHEAQPVGPVISRNHFASWLVLATPIAVGYLIAHGRSHWIGSTRTKQLVRMLSDARALWLGGCAVLMVAGVVYSQSRAGLFGLLAAMVVGIIGSWRSLGNRGRVGLVVVSVALGSIAWLLANPSHVLKRINGEDTVAWGGRPAVWRATLDMAGRYPATGVGLGAYEGAMPFYQPEPRVPIFNHAHNQYLQWLSEGGVPGVVIAAAVLILAFGLFRRRHFLDNGSLVHVREGAFAGMIGLAVQSIWETPLVTPCVLWMLAAAAGLATSRPAVSHTPERRR